ncbi:MAG TPA: dTDP-4-dehydrorhamnose 3,5-epimerase [Miltoncostaeaceae bacterium]|nr:dTDP-4-dehydrorhamnose 3,5-epimerase [Miltoncostaeaceae bacterium]
MEVLATGLPDVRLVRPRVHADARGFFAETYRDDRLRAAGITETWVQDNHSRSSRGVLRGLHFQTAPGQAKLVRCARGAILDVVVDLRRGSPAYGRWEAHRLADEDLRMLYIPIGFAHGFCVLSETADVVYRCSSYYDAATEAGIAWDDPDVGVEWPLAGEAVVSDRDRAAPRLREVADGLPFVYGA